MEEAAMDSFSVIVAAPIMAFVALGFLGLTLGGLCLFCQGCRDYLKGNKQSP